MIDVRQRLRRFLWRHVPRPMLVVRYVRVFGRIPRLVRPRTFTEHLLVKLLFDRDPKLALFADKLAVRAYVAERLGGEQHLTTVYATVDRADQIVDLDLPNRFVMKPNHLSGAIKVVRDLASTDRAALVALAAPWFARNLGAERGEWAYRHIRPRVLFEELLESDGGPPSDYRFYCFDGEPRLISLTNDWLGPDPTSALYDVDFKLLEARQLNTVSRHLKVQAPRPPSFEQMLDVARRLSAGTDFVRVDLYNLGGRIVFGELTNYPAGGLRKFDPASFDLTVGSYWH